MALRHTRMSAEQRWEERQRGLQADPPVAGAGGQYMDACMGIFAPDNPVLSNLRHVDVSAVRTPVQTLLPGDDADAMQAPQPDCDSDGFVGGEADEDADDGWVGPDDGETPEVEVCEETLALFEMLEAATPETMRQRQTLVALRSAARAALKGTEAVTVGAVLRNFGWDGHTFRVPTAEVMNGMADALQQELARPGAAQKPATVQDWRDKGVGGGQGSKQPAKRDRVHAEADKNDGYGIFSADNPARNRPAMDPIQAMLSNFGVSETWMQYILRMAKKWAAFVIIIAVMNMRRFNYMSQIVQGGFAEAQTLGSAEAAADPASAG
eukprot:TRINITY_DN39806_c0_g1_i1.p1 TRINITY_DN39806_c0_g1~~TRINITY_DN39806_c0_g1_i1.p1  ORF type:complete len:324 (+),score=108.38 TRINITY_DN39806_c0_g1_i1:58-1029(+)